MPKAPRLHGPRPLKELGQHFLQDEETASQIVAAMGLRWEERALEIGPGRGVLLRFLLKKSHRVTAIELDRRLQKSLQKTFGGHPGLELIFLNFLKFDLLAYALSEASPAKLVGNIPYSLSHPILLRIFEAAEGLQDRGRVPLQSATLMLQREVAERICARPGERACGSITLLRSLVADAEMLFNVPPGAFIPAPQVMSSVIQLKFFPRARFQVEDQPLFAELVYHVFKQRRKMLKNSIGGLPWIQSQWQKVEFDFTRRPEELPLDDFVKLFSLLKPMSRKD